MGPCQAPAPPPGPFVYLSLFLLEKISQLPSYGFLAICVMFCITVLSLYCSLSVIVFFLSTYVWLSLCFGVPCCLAL